MRHAEYRTDRHGLGDHSGQWADEAMAMKWA